jgi:hypothetical protein
MDGLPGLLVVFCGIFFIGDGDTNSWRRSFHYSSMIIKFNISCRRRCFTEFLMLHFNFYLFIEM